MHNILLIYLHILNITLIQNYSYVGVHTSICGIIIEYWSN